MYCVYAFLLIPHDDLKNTKRLAILDNKFFDPYYSIFKPKADEFFPHVPPRMDIITTKFENVGPGTYPKAYCSNTLSNKKLIKIITSDLENVDGKSHLGFGAADPAAKQCLEVLENLSPQEKDPLHQMPDADEISEVQSTRLLKDASHQPPKILLSNIRGRPGCSDFGLISLAYQKRIKVTGFDLHFAPEHSEPQHKEESNVLYEVNFNERVDIYNIVYSSQLFAHITYEKKFYALAWYMGYLHIFKKNSQNSQWWPETIIGQENRNGDKIIEFIDKQYKILKSVSKMTEEIEEHIGDASCCFMDCFSGEKSYRQEYNRLIAEFQDMKLKRFPPAFLVGKPKDRSQGSSK